MLALHDPSEQLNGLGQLWMPRPYDSSLCMQNHI